MCTEPSTAAAAIDGVDLVNQSSAAAAVEAAEKTMAATAWDDVSGLEEQQRRHLRRLHAKGVLWKHPGREESSSPPVVFRLSHGGEVSSDGNCLFTASQKAMEARGVDARDLRRRAVRRFLEDFGSAGEEEKEAVREAIRHMYSPDLKTGWGIHIVQEEKLLAKKEERESLDSAIDELVQIGMQRETAAESIYRERCVPVNDGPSWAKYMSVSGSSEDEHDIISLQYTEDGLLSVDENRQGHAAAFGDDIAIECLATEFKREIYVVQAHGSDGMVEEENCVFFLPHKPRSEVIESPVFLFMKGTGWCGGGADHYEPLIASPSQIISQEKVAFRHPSRSQPYTITVVLVGVNKCPFNFLSMFLMFCLLNQNLLFLIAPYLVVRLNLTMASLSSSVTSRSYRSGYLGSFSPLKGSNRQRPLSFLSASPRGLSSHELCVRFQRNSTRSSVFMQDGAIVTNSNSTESASSLKGFKEEVLSVLSQEAAKVGEGSDGQSQSTVSITVVGASGDLAKKKIFPALFALYYEDCLPEHFTIFGYSRSKMTDAELRNMVSKTLTCRIDKRANCGEKMEEFLKRCFYHSGQYDSQEHFTELDKKLKEHEAGRMSNRLFYLSIPPNIFVDAVKCASSSASSVNGWTRVIVEKPFGRDSETSAALTNSLKQYLEEDQIFRIDHYLGKELVENLSVLRFSNLIFEPLWSRQYIRNVQFIFSEDFGTEGRGGYFDHYGIIRDIMQNHLLQILALFAMETPVSLDAEDIRNEKVKVLRSMRPIQVEDVVIGQYKSHTKGGVTYPGYTDDKTVPKGSLTPTFAAAALFIDNARWDGVPFLMKAGKALHTRRAEIRVQFRHVPGNLYNRNNTGCDLDKATNELVIRVQPDEAIYLKVNNKVPGLGMRLDRSNLNLLYSARYSKEIPDAYERLLLDAIEGERRLFIRSDELDAAWSLFTPLLKEIEEKKRIPEYYPYGSRGPVGAHYLAAKHKVQWGDISLDQ
ncbi:hypothetical protein HID58_089232 [Brassica napus]|uniref:Glucose-6-phosphate 1-dehydrogenase n=2 Tax=Brassica napus TaxID=3708 RepID=A0ABQ7XYF0_BRANA|nr:hypothetical protein HID58_089232 [Brassica napus]